MALDLSVPSTVDSSAPDMGSPAPDASQSDPSALAADTQKPTFDVPDDSLSQFGLDQAQVGDQITATFTLTITAKTPGADAVGSEGGAGSTTFSVDDVQDVQDAGAEAPDDDVSDEPTPPTDNGGADGDAATSPKIPGGADRAAGDPTPASDRASALGFTPKKRNTPVSPKDAGFKTSKG